MGGGQTEGAVLAYPRRRGIKNPSRETLLVETTTPLPYCGPVAKNNVSIRSSRLVGCSPQELSGDVSDTLKRLASLILDTDDPTELRELRRDVAWLAGPFLLGSPEKKFVDAAFGLHSDRFVKIAAKELLDVSSKTDSGGHPTSQPPSGKNPEPIEGVIPSPGPDKPNFRRELTKLLNRFGKDTACGTTDYQLAEFVDRTLAALAATK